MAEEAEEVDPSFWENRRHSLTKLKGNIAQVRKYIEELPSGSGSPASAANSRKDARSNPAPQLNGRRATNRPGRGGGSGAQFRNAPGSALPKGQQKPPSGNTRQPPKPNYKQRLPENKDDENNGRPPSEFSNQNSDASTPLFSEPLFKPLSPLPDLAPPPVVEIKVEEKRKVAPPAPRQRVTKKKPRTPPPPASAATSHFSADSELMVPFARLSPSVHLNPTGTPTSLLSSATPPRKWSRDSSADSRSRFGKRNDVKPVNVSQEERERPEDPPPPAPVANGNQSEDDTEKKGGTPEKPSSAKDDSDATAWKSAQSAASRRRRRERQHSADSALVTNRARNARERERDREREPDRRKRPGSGKSDREDDSVDSDSRRAERRRRPPVLRAVVDRGPGRGLPPRVPKALEHPERQVHSVAPQFGNGRTTPHHVPARPASSYIDRLIDEPIPTRPPFLLQGRVGGQAPGLGPGAGPVMDNLQYRKYIGYLQSRYPHICNDALIPVPVPVPVPLPPPLGAPVPLPMPVPVPGPVPPPVLVTAKPPMAPVAVSRGPVQNVYVNSVTNGGDTGSDTSRVKIEFIDHLIDEEMVDQLIPDILRDCIEDLKLQDRHNRIRWEKLKVEYAHDDFCQADLVDSLIATAIEDDILPELLNEMISRADEWLLDEDEAIARRMVDDILSIDMTLMVQALCRDTMNELIDSYLRKHSDELTFEEVLALDWYDQTLTSEILRLVRESLDELITAEIERHVSYEIFRQLLLEEIHDTQDGVVAETLHECAILDPILEESLLEPVIDELVPGIVQDALNEWSLAGIRQLENEVRSEFGRWLLDSITADYVLGGFALQGLTRFDSEGLDRTLNAVLFDQLFITMLDINRSQRGSLENKATKFTYDKIFTGLAVDALLDRLVEETDQNLCDEDFYEVENPAQPVVRDMDTFLFGIEDKYRHQREEAERAAASPPPPPDASTGGENAEDAPIAI